MLVHEREKGRKKNTINIMRLGERARGPRKAGNKIHKEEEEKKIPDIEIESNLTESARGRPGGVRCVVRALRGRPSERAVLSFGPDGARHRRLGAASFYAADSP